tara:strand:- start:915 stop:1334 length:420 start_codon:yes stop_codon:yes gene_type:complete
MNYKFSARELLLIKILAAIAFILVFFYGTSFVANEINKSKNLIFYEVDKFNEKKQLLAQIQALENNKNLELSKDDFLLNLTKNNITYELKGDEIVIPGLSNLDALEIMTNIEESNVDINAFKFSVGESTNIILTIKFNG